MRDESPTPVAWYSHATIAAECRRNAERLRIVALQSRKRVDVLDFARARRADELAVWLTSAAGRISGWSLLTAEELIVEQAEFVPVVLDLLREALKVLESMPKSGPLGPLSRG